MFKLFRKIRYNLMKQNKTSRYFKYALGEIVLVVIGILIALQINNWNENRKNRQFESEIITLINDNLLKDSTSLTLELKKSKIALASTDRLLTQVSQGVYNDSLHYLIGDIMNFQRFKSQSSAFEVLKSKGIENIRNNRLQLALISYYDEILFKTYQSMLDVEKSFITDWVPVIKEDFIDFKWMQYAVPTNSQAFFEKPSTIILFKLFKDNRIGQVERMETAIAKITEIRTLLTENKK